MGEISVHYGVQKLVAINSGKFSFAELDLTGPVHLAAPNNRGKSTLVNALQFLYVDDLRAMKFGRDRDDTRRHYFGQNPSYLIFECMTPLGIKCLLVVGQGPLTNYEFSRFVYDGPFDLDDFCGQDQRPLTLDRVRPGLAGRGLAEVKPGNLWEVLGDPRHRGNNGSLPRLNILPIRSVDEYRSFREAFIRLLSLSKVSAKELRELVIACHARDLSCSRIDVAAEHRDDFERADQAELRMRLTHAVRDKVGRGIVLRENIRAILRQLQLEMPVVDREVGKTNRLLERLHGSLEAERKELDEEGRKLSSALNGLREQKGELRIETSQKKKTLEDLDRLHAHWGPCTDNMIQTMNDNRAAFISEIARLDADLDRSRRVPFESVRRHVESLERDIESGKRVLANWDRRAINTLRDVGLADDEVARAFQLLNPQLLDLAVGQDITVLDAHALKRQLLTLTSATREGHYRDAAIDINLKHIRAPAFGESANRDRLTDDLKARDEELREARRRLAVAKDQAATEQILKEKRTELDQLDGRLREYHDYTVKWATKPQLVEELSVLAVKLKEVESDITSFEGRRGALGIRRGEVAVIQHETGRRRKGLVDAMGECRQEQSSANIGVSSEAGAEADDDAAAVPEWAELRSRCDHLEERITRIRKDTRSVSHIQSELGKLQVGIAEQSRGFERQEVYFSDADADWDRLLEMVESIAEQQQVVEQAWTSLFTRIAAKLNDIRQGVTAIRSAISRVNTGLGEYRVSNLRSVKLEVVVQDETYGMVETLTNEGGIFQDHEKLDHAKEHMRGWIRDGKVIQLDELFAIHIKVHDLDKEKPTEARSLDEIGSIGTGMTAKAMVFIQLVRAVVSEDRYRLHFFIDETGQLDGNNLAATTRMAVSRGVIPITADPNVRIEPLAHPTVTVYTLGQDKAGLYCIDGMRVCRARRTGGEVSQGH